jgi:hypothetical protein
MKKFLLGLAFAGAVLFAAQNAMAQCCDKVDLDGDSNTPAVGCAASAPGATCGCVDVPGVACVGGDVSGPAGCIGVAGTVYIASESPPDSAGDCATAAASACQAAGCALP